MSPMVRDAGLMLTINGLRSGRGYTWGPLSVEPVADGTFLVRGPAGQAVVPTAIEAAAAFVGGVWELGQAQAGSNGSGPHGATVGVRRSL